MRHHDFIARFTQIDYARAMAFVAIDEANGDLLGVVRLHANAEGTSSEFAILVRSDKKQRGLGWKLMRLMIEYTEATGIQSICGQILDENIPMLDMCRELGFRIEQDSEDASVMLVQLSLL